MSLNENMVSDIVKEVMARLSLSDAGDAPMRGIFTDMNEAIAAAKKAQQVVKKMTMDQREKIITNIRRLAFEKDV